MDVDFYTAFPAVLEAKMMPTRIVYISNLSRAFRRMTRAYLDRVNSNSDYSDDYEHQLSPTGYPYPIAKTSSHRQIDNADSTSLTPTVDESLALALLSASLSRTMSMSDVIALQPNRTNTCPRFYKYRREHTRNFKNKGENVNNHPRTLLPSGHRHITRRRSFIRVVSTFLFMLIICAIIFFITFALSQSRSGCFLAFGVITNGRPFSGATTSVE